ncbi:MAG: alpha/beta hydrolase [Pseudomonadota bacterium]
MIGRWTLTLCLALALTACAPRGIIEPGNSVVGATVRGVYVARFRQDTGQARNFGEARSGELVFGRVDVSIPPNHEVGRIEWPRGEPNGATDFVTVGGAQYPDINQFARAIAAADKSGENETVLHVHGYNTTHGEAVYGTAQVAHDLEVPVPMVVFSWPSAAQTAGYVYDRDSALISRDILEEVIVTLARQPNRKLFLTAHSMGSHLLMETLRQIALSGRLDLEREINGVILMAPDIDTELFREQVSRMGDLPVPFIVMIAEQDRALRFSGTLTGRGVRLGSIDHPEDLAGLGLTVVDVGSLSDGRRFDHNIATTSPAALAIFKRLNEVTPPGDLHVVDSVVQADQAGGFLSRIVGGQ